MAWPYLFQASFDSARFDYDGGGGGEWDTETDTSSQLDFPSYKTLAGISTPRNLAPFSGSHCMRVVLVSGNTNDAIVLQGDVNVAVNTEAVVKFDMLIGSDFDGTADNITILEFQAGGTPEALFGISLASDGDVTTYIAEVGITNVEVGTTVLERGIWYTIEMFISVDNSDTSGTIDLWVTREGQAPTTTTETTQITGLTQSAITDAVLGVQEQLSATVGTILFDNVVFDDIDSSSVLTPEARIYPTVRRFDRSRTMTTSGTLFVGPGRVTQFTGIGSSTTGATSQISLYDTDEGDLLLTTSFENVIQFGNALAVLTPETNRTAVSYGGQPIQFHRGCYVHLEDTATLTGGDKNILPMASLTFEKTPAFGSVAAIRNYGAKGGA